MSMIKKSKKIQVHVTPRQYGEWVKAAQYRDMELVDWIRTKLDEEAAPQGMYARLFVQIAQSVRGYCLACKCTVFHHPGSESPDGPCPECGAGSEMIQSLRPEL